jgi:hypothetical protein
MNFIEFNGKNICYKRIDGVIWIVVKSVCEAINVNYNRQFQNIREDPILISAFAKQQMQIPPDDQKREYICLPEMYVYGWIFQIKSDSPELLEYKRECYYTLYNHFHGQLTKRTALYRELSETRKSISDFEQKMAEIDGYEDYLNVKMRYARIWKQIKESSFEPGLFDNEVFSDK